MRSARGLALLCGFLKNDEWVLTLSWGSKRIDTKVSILLGLQRKSESGDRFENKSTAEDFFFRVFLNRFAVSDNVLLHIRLNLRRRNMTVLRNPLVRCNARHLRI